MSWICKSCGCENSSTMTVCCNCGKSLPKVSLNKNHHITTSSNGMGSRSQVSLTKPTTNVKNDISRPKPVPPQSTNVKPKQGSTVKSVAVSQPKNNDALIKLFLVVGGIFVLVLFIVFVNLVRNNNSQGVAKVETTSEETTVTTVATTTDAVITTELTTTTALTTTEATTTTVTTPVTTVAQTTPVLTVAPQDTTIATKQSSSKVTTALTSDVTTKPSSNGMPNGYRYSTNFTTYRNDSFHYSVKYPDNFYTSSDSDSGCELTDGYAKVRLSSYENSEGLSSRSAYDSAVSQVGQAMYYQLVKDNYYIMSWLQDGDVVYRKVFVGDRITCLEFRYSKDYKDVYDTMITEMVLSFTVD